MRIDVFCHVLPPRYLDERNRRAGSGFGTQYAKYFSANPGLTDLDIRYRILDKFPDLRQLLTIAGPNVESITAPRDAVELARIANDELAGMVSAHPDRFVGAAACLPMSDVDAVLLEADRAIQELGFRGVEIFTDINGRRCRRCASRAASAGKADGRLRIRRRSPPPRWPCRRSIPGTAAG